MARESFTLPWRDLLRALRRMEARGTVRGGRFVSGFMGEQYAKPEAVQMLREVRRKEGRRRTHLHLGDRPLQSRRHRLAGDQSDGPCRVGPCAGRRRAAKRRRGRRNFIELAPNRSAKQARSPLALSPRPARSSRSRPTCSSAAIPCRRRSARACPPRRTARPADSEAPLATLGCSVKSLGQLTMQSSLTMRSTLSSVPSSRFERTE